MASEFIDSAWDYFWTVVLMLFIVGFLFGGFFSDVFEALVSWSRGGRRRGRLEGQLRAKDDEIKRLNGQLAAVQSGLKAVTGTPDTSEVAQLARQVRELVDQQQVWVEDRLVMADLLSRIQAADQTYPQLGQDLRDEIDRAVTRSRPASPDQVPSVRKGRKSLSRGGAS